MSYPPPPPGLTYIAVAEPLLDLLIISAIGSSILIPVGISLLLFSTSAQRTQPIFFLNFVSIALGVIQGAFNIYEQHRGILARPIHPTLYIVNIVIFITIPLFADTILLLRVIAVYPPRFLSKASIAAVYGPVFVIKVARLVNIVMFAVHWASQLGDNPTSIFQAGQNAWNSPFPKIEWMFMLFDNSYMSMLFLLRLRKSRKSTTRVASATATNQKSSSYASRLKALFWIAVSNFVIPVILTLVQLVFVFCDRDWFHGSYVFIVNTHIQIVGVIMATIWCTGMRWSDSGRPCEEDQRYPPMTNVRLAPGQSASETVTEGEDTRGGDENYGSVYDMEVQKSTTAT